LKRPAAPITRKPSARGRPLATREVSPQQIVEITRRRIREGGFANVSMRQVADELDVTATALYHHFPNKDSLLDEVAEQIYAAIPMPDCSLPWTERLHRWLLAQERIHLEHPGLARFLLARHSQSTAAFRWIDSVLQILSEGGLDDDEQVLCMNHIGFLHNPLIYLDGPQRELEARSGSVVARTHRQVLDGAYPHLARLVDKLPASPQQDNFERTLGNAIAALAAAVARGRTRARPAVKRPARVQSTKRRA
jgi:AcrR family transcriptional regulator